MNTKEKILEALKETEECVICGKEASVECQDADGTYRGSMCDGCSSRHLVEQYG